MFKIQKRTTDSILKHLISYEVWEGNGFICSCGNREQAEFIIEAINNYDNKPVITKQQFSAFSEYLK